MLWAVTFTAAIDGGTPTSYHFDGLPNCCDILVQPGYNFTIYDIQSLSPGNHTLVIALLDAGQGSKSAAFGENSTLSFDYALVNNDTSPHPTSSVSSSASLSVSPSPSTSSSSMLASRSR
jgi:hypothetical protein